MTEWDTFRNILDNIYDKVLEYYKKKDNTILTNLSDVQRKWLEILVQHIEKQKSVVAVVVTSLLKKIESPNQDVRLHRDEFDGGYAGRSLDTNVVTPWLKEHFPRFAPKESGWLTRSIEQPRPFTKDFPGKIRNKDVKYAFLSILEDIEENQADPQKYLMALLYLLLKKYKQEMQIISNFKRIDGGKGSPLTIDIIINMLKEHFSEKMASRLPVIAVYSIYQILMRNVKLYENKILAPLKTHTTSDRYKGFGDIEVYNSDGTPFEVVEIKHNIPIDKTMILDILKKVKDTSVKRYYILTTAEPNFKEEEKEEIFDLVHKIKRRYNIEIIPNGIIPSLKYYLRFVPDLKEFIEKYTENLTEDFKQSTDVKEFHITKLRKIRKKYKL